jgi:hypothetical protein
MVCTGAEMVCKGILLETKKKREEPERGGGGEEGCIDREWQ